MFMKIPKLDLLSSIQISNNQKYIGEKFGSLTVLELLGKVPNGYKIAVSVKCDCGNTKSVNLDSLKKGLTKSCGCYISENPSRLTHGKSKTPLYYVWLAMLRRCQNKKDSRYSSYGGVGISVCAEWDDFLEFEKWSFNTGYIKGLQIDRVDCFGNYEPSNCRFVTASVNVNNKKNSIRVLLDGVVLTSLEASLVLGKNRNYITRIKNGKHKNPFPDRLQFLGDYETWSKLYPEHR